jgi:DNA gyrase/topoisomerase IV subunit A
MDIKIENKDSKTTMFIEADLDRIVAENFGDICQALAKHVNTLSELQNLHYQNVQIEDLIATIRSCHDGEEAKERISQRYNISATASQFILRTSISNLDKVLDVNYLDQEIEQCMDHIQTVIWPLFSY